MLKPEVTESYDKLHEDYLKGLVEYHNAYLKYIKGSVARVNMPPMRATLKRLLELNRLMLKEVGKVNKAKKESNKEKYQEHRQRTKK